MASLVMEVPVLVAANTPMPMKKVEVADPAPHEVRVKMTASGVCHSCLHAYDGSHETPMPMILGRTSRGGAITERLWGRATASVEDRVLPPEL